MVRSADSDLDRDRRGGPVVSRDLECNDGNRQPARKRAAAADAASSGLEAIPFAAALGAASMENRRLYFDASPTTMAPPCLGAAYLALYATFAAEVGESYIIDVQHWRHYFLIMGVLVGPRHCRRRAPPGRMLTPFASNLFPPQPD